MDEYIDEGMNTCKWVDGMDEWDGWMGWMIAIHEWKEWMNRMDEMNKGMNGEVWMNEWIHVKKNSLQIEVVQFVIVV